MRVTKVIDTDVNSKSDDEEIIREDLLKRFRRLKDGHSEAITYHKNNVLSNEDFETFLDEYKEDDIDTAFLCDFKERLSLFSELDNTNEFEMYCNVVKRINENSNDQLDKKFTINRRT